MQTISSANLIDLLASKGEEVALFANDGATASYKHISSQLNYVSKFWQQHFACSPRICVLLDDHPSVPVLLTGCCLAGTAIPSNPAYSQHEIEALFEDADIDVFVVEQVSDWLLEKADEYSFSIVTLVRNQPEHLVDFTLDIIFKHNAQNFTKDRKFEKQPSKPALVLMTSGSTGRPKRVPLTFDALMISVQNIAQTLDLSEKDTVVNMLPMFHIGAIVDLFLTPLLSGGKVFFAHPVSIENLISGIRKSSPTWFQAVPTMLISMLQTLTEEELKEIGQSLRFVRSVSSDLAPAVQYELEAKLGNVPIVQMYGMTETAGQICSNPTDIKSRKIGSVGVVRFHGNTSVGEGGIEVAILDRFGNFVKEGNEGEICVKGATVTFGYEKTHSQDYKFGEWFRTGDVGYVDEDGYLFISGRHKDIINRGGEKISAVEIEQILYSIESVAVAAVVAIPHKTLGEEPAAFLVVQAGKVLEEETVEKVLSEKLATFKMPRRIKFLKAMPKLGSGKVDKLALRQMFSSNAETNGADETFYATPLGEPLAKIWSETLKSSSPKPRDDFFDAGGDSLLAQNFIFRLEDLIRTTLPSNVLYESPTFEALEKTLYAHSSDETEATYSLELPEEVFSAVKNHTASWKGARRNPQSLVVSLNSAGSNTPVFYCDGDEENYEDLVAELGSDHPFYVMRTLSNLGDLQTDKNMRLLVKKYADEIHEIYPEGPLVIGGFCKGAVIGKMLSDEFSTRGRGTDLFVIVDRVLRENHSGKALVAYSAASFASVRSWFKQPELGHRYAFPTQKPSILEVDIEHKHCTRGEGARLIASAIEKELAILDESSSMEDKNSSCASDLRDMRRELYQADIALHTPAFPKGGSEIVVQAKITNTSSQQWAPTTESGLRLLAKWERMNKRPFHYISASADIDEPVNPGETVTLSFPIYFPKKSLPLTLLVDMVDEGVSWFHHGNSHTKPARKRIMRRLW